MTPIAEDILAHREAAPVPAQAGDPPLTGAERGSLRRKVLMLSWPVIIENLLQSTIGFVDTALVGHLGTDALAGVGGAQQLVWLTTTALSAVMMGATVLVAHAIGAKEPAEARRIFKQALTLSIAIALVLSAGTYALAEPAVRLLGMDAGATAAGVLYLQISGVTMPFMVLMFAGSAVLRGAGDTRTPMYITGFINVINALAAWWMIYGFGPIPAFGVAGSAWAAAVARAIGCIILAWVFFQPQRILHLRERGGWRPDLSLIKRMLNVGLPTAAEQFMLSFGITLFGLIVISLGTDVYATQRASMMIIMMAFLPGFGFAMAATTLVGQAMGAAKPRQAEESGWIAARWCMLLMGSIGLIFGLFGEPLMHVFSNDPAVTRLGGEVLAIAALSQPFMALGQVLSGGLRGAGDTRYPMVITMVAIWGIRLPLGWLLGIPLGLGLHGVYIAYVLDNTMRALFALWRWRKGRWKTIRV
jgi:putative MATE family efflux protein